MWESMQSDLESLKKQILAERLAIAKETDEFIRESAEKAIQAARAARADGRHGDAIFQLWMAETWLGLLNRR